MGGGDQRQDGTAGLIGDGFDLGVLARQSRQVGEGAQQQGRAVLNALGTSHERGLALGKGGGSQLGAVLFPYGVERGVSREGEGITRIVVGDGIVGGQRPAEEGVALQGGRGLGEGVGCIDRDLGGLGRILAAVSVKGQGVLTRGRGHEEEDAAGQVALLVSICDPRHIAVHLMQSHGRACGDRTDTAGSARRLLEGGGVAVDYVDTAKHTVLIGPVYGRLVPLVIGRGTVADDAGIVQSIGAHRHVVVGVALNGEDVGIGGVQDVADVARVRVGVLPVEEDHVGGLGGVGALVGGGVLPHIHGLQLTHPLPTADLGGGLIKAGLVQAPVDEAGAPLVGVVVVVGDQQAGVFDVVGGAAFVHTVKILGGVALVVAQLGDGDAEDVVAVVGGQLQGGEVLVPNRGFVGVRELVAGIVGQPVSALDARAVRLQSGHGGSGNGGQKKGGKQDRQKLFAGHRGSILSVSMPYYTMGEPVCKG